jgi:hypothetical protein
VDRDVDPATPRTVKSQLRAGHTRSIASRKRDRVPCNPGDDLLSCVAEYAHLLTSLHQVVTKAGARVRGGCLGVPSAGCLVGPCAGDDVVEFFGDGHGLVAEPFEVSGQ